MIQLGGGGAGLGCRDTHETPRPGPRYGVARREILVTSWPGKVRPATVIISLHIPVMSHSDSGVCRTVWEGKTLAKNSIH